MDPVARYFEGCARAIEAQALRPLLQLDSPEANAAARAFNPDRPTPAAQRAGSSLGTFWHPFIMQHLIALRHRQQGSLEAACSVYAENKQGCPTYSLCDHIRHQAPHDVWLEGVLDQVFQNAEQLAKEGDAASSSTRLMDAFGGLATSCVSTISMPRGEKPGQLRCYVRLLLVRFKVLLRLNQIMQCVGMLKTLQPVMENLRGIPAAMATSLYYYVGLAYMYNEQLEEAEGALRHAFRLCHNDYGDNRRAILRALIPVMLLLGYLPADELLQGRSLEVYRLIKAALEAGDVGLLERTLTEARLQFIQEGTYLLMEKLMLLCYRRLLQRVLAFHAETAEKPNQLPLGLLLGTLEAQGVESDMEALQCTVGTLIVRNYVKGYMSYTQQVLVVAKVDAFPDVAAKWYTDPF